MYGILGEDTSDVNTLKVIIRRLHQDERMQISGKGYDGCAQLLRKGARQLEAMVKLGCTRFIIAYDADDGDPSERRKEVQCKVVKPSGVGDKCCCIVIPVQELESWILADIAAVTRIISSWRPSPVAYPESIASPKEALEKLSRNSKHRPRYVHAMHNEQVAKYIDLAMVERKCESFKPLKKFVVDNMANGLSKGT